MENIIEKLREICSIPEKERASSKIGRHVQNIEEVVYSNACKYSEWVDGERYACGLALGHKGKCMLGSKVDE